jgi:O-antigen ligase
LTPWVCPELLDEMPSARTATAREIAIGSYCAFLIFVLTQGPVYKLVYSDAQSSLKPDAIAVASAIFVIVQIPVLMTTRMSEIRHHGKDIYVIYALCAILLLTSIWSTARAVTITAAVSFSLTAMAAIGIAVLLQPKMVMWSVLIGLQPGLLLSAYAVHQKWPQATEPKSSLEPWITTNNWVGIYGNRNSLAPVAGIGVATCLFVIWNLLRGPSRFKALKVAPVIVVVGFDLFVLVQSGSATIPFALVITSIVLLVSNLIRLIAQRKSDVVHHRPMKYSIMLLFFSLSIFSLRWLHERYDRLSGFDGRTDYWRATFEAWKTRPLFGWGFMALWNTETFRNSLPQRLAGATWGHSSYLDALAGGGLVLALLFLTVIGAVIFRALFATSNGSESTWMSFVVLTILLASTQESFLLGNHFFLLLLIYTGLKLRINKLSTGIQH